VKEEPVKATKSKKRFEEIVGALMRVPKEEADAIIEAEKKPRSGAKRGRKPKSG
jgi:hypothetical protein